MPKTCGIYKITSPSGKIYIGQSKNITRRKGEYRNNKVYEQAKLFYSLRKYGFEAHTFEVIEVCTAEKLNESEVFFIWLFDTYNTPHGLNLTSGGTSSSDKRTRHKPMLPVYVKHPDGEIKKFISVYKCAEVMSLNIQSIRRACRLSRVHKEHCFSYSGDFDVLFKGTKSRSDGKPVYVKELHGEITRYDSIAACCEALSVWNTRLSHHIRTGRRFRGWFRFSFDPECPPVTDTFNKTNKRVYAKDLQGVVTEYPTIVSCAKKLGVEADTITQSIKHDRWSRTGYYFSHTPLQ